MNALDLAQERYDSMLPYDEEPAGIEISDQEAYELMAGIWVAGGCDARDFDKAIPEILGTLANGATFTDNDVIIDMADCWIEQGGDVKTFIRCAGQIRGWIVVEMSARGKITRRAA